MDAQTKLIIEYESVRHKIGYDATGLFGAAIKAAGRWPDMLVTDDLAGFKTGYRKAMYTIALPRTVHMADAGIRDKHTANNVYKRFNGEIRDRIARIRGFKSRGSRTAWFAGRIPQLHASARGPGRQDSGRG